MLFIVDVDGTIAEISHRLHFIQQEPKDWGAFFAAAGKDEPIWEVISVVRALRETGGHKIIISTGRSEDIRMLTVEWLRKFRVPFDAIYMRKSGDHREDNVVKSELLDKIIADNPTLKLGGAFEDRQQVVDMYRDRGLKVFQVAKGNF